MMTPLEVHATLVAGTVSQAETEETAAACASVLELGDLVLLSGELGAGKTVFVRAAARALGIDEQVTSPSFTIGHVYSGPLEVAHLDLYRISDLDEEDPALVADYLTDDRVAFVEWPGEGAPELAEPRLAVRIDAVDLNRRRIEVAGDPGGLRQVYGRLHRTLRDRVRLWEHGERPR